MYECVTINVNVYVYCACFYVWWGLFAFSTQIYLLSVTDIVKEQVDITKHLPINSKAYVYT